MEGLASRAGDAASDMGDSAASDGVGDMEGDVAGNRTGDGTGDVAGYGACYSIDRAPRTELQMASTLKGQMIVHALFIDPNGPYPLIHGVDCWDERRNALKFQGTGPVILHPPCGRWGSMARINEKRWGARVGDDGGLFKFALEILYRNGGVLEHPARSLAWDWFGLPKPSKHSWGWSHAGKNMWFCEVWQSAYGHPCHKRTWLLYVGKPEPLDLDWQRDKSRATHQIGGGIHTGNRSKPRLDDRLVHITPFSFAVALVKLVQMTTQAH